MREYRGGGWPTGAMRRETASFPFTGHCKGALLNAMRLQMECVLDGPLHRIYELQYSHILCAYNKDPCHKSKPESHNLTKNMLRDTGHWDILTKDTTGTEGRMSCSVTPWRRLGQVVCLSQQHGLHWNKGE